MRGLTVQKLIVINGLMLLLIKSFWKKGIFTRRWWGWSSRRISEGDIEIQFSRYSDLIWMLWRNHAGLHGLEVADRFFGRFASPLNWLPINFSIMPGMCESFHVQVSLSVEVGRPQTKRVLAVYVSGEEDHHVNCSISGCYNISSMTLQRSIVWVEREA